MLSLEREGLLPETCPERGLVCYRTRVYVTAVHPEVRVVHTSSALGAILGGLSWGQGQRKVCL